jgi:hypothetical protein
VKVGWASQPKLPSSSVASSRLTLSVPDQVARLVARRATRAVYCLYITGVSYQLFLFVLLLIVPSSRRV